MDGRQKDSSLLRRENTKSRDVYALLKTYPIRRLDDRMMAVGVMRICHAIVVALVGLTLFSVHPAAAGDVLYRLDVDQRLSPLLRGLVIEEFSKDPDLRSYLDPYDDPDWCRDPLKKFGGATAPLNPQ